MSGLYPSLQSCITGTPHPFNQWSFILSIDFIFEPEHQQTDSSPHRPDLLTKIWKGGGGARALQRFGAEKHFYWIDDTCDISDFRTRIFCPQTTQELPKKHNEARLPEQPPTDALSQIDYRHTRHCEDCLCQWTMQRALWKIWVGVSLWLSWRWAPRPTVSKCSVSSAIYNILVQVQ